MVNYYAIIPATVRYDQNLKPNAKLLYGEITALCNAKGFCWASNEYFAELYGVSSATVSRWVSMLEREHYISVEVLKMQGNKRKIVIDKNVNTYCRNNQEVLTKKSIAIDEKVKSTYNNTINTTDKNGSVFALDFYVENFPVEYESFLMKYKRHINNWKMFVSNFNAVCEKEELNFSQRAISGRLVLYANNWIERTKRTENRDWKNEGKIVKPEFKKIG